MKVENQYSTLKKIDLLGKQLLKDTIHLIKVLLVAVAAEEDTTFPEEEALTAAVVTAGNEIVIRKQNTKEKPPLPWQRGLTYVVNLLVMTNYNIFALRVSPLSGEKYAGGMSKIVLHPVWPSWCIRYAALATQTSTLVVNSGFESSFKLYSIM